MTDEQLEQGTRELLEPFQYPIWNKNVCLFVFFFFKTIDGLINGFLVYLSSPIYYWTRLWKSFSLSWAWHLIRSLL